MTAGPAKIDPIAAALRYWRAVNRIKQSHLAELLAVSQATISRWEAGSQVPTTEDRHKIESLLSARLDGGADRELARLITLSGLPMHLMCDVTHKMLALSPERMRTTTLSSTELVGTSLWRFASDEIIEHEQKLGHLGWFNSKITEVHFVTGFNKSPNYRIIPGVVRYVRFRLSDGTHARLVESLPLHSV